MSRKTVLSVFLPSAVFFGSERVWAEAREVVSYQAPRKTPYDRKPHLKAQYLKAHKASWINVVLLFSRDDLAQAIEDEDPVICPGGTTCCEATRNVTQGWYRGQDDAELFLERLAKLGKKDTTIVSRYVKLLREIERNPIGEWYVFDGYDPKKTVKEIEDRGRTRIVITYRDWTKTKLLEVKRYEGRLLHGISEQYDANGELSTITPHKRGLVDGVVVELSDTGAILGRIPHVRGKRHGVELWYNEEGEMTTYSEWSGGERNGRQIRFEDGEMYRFFKWKNGKQHGLCVYYQGDEEEISKGSEYRNGREIRKLAALTPLSALPAEYRMLALRRFREEHRRKVGGAPSWGIPKAKGIGAPKEGAE